MGYAFHGAENHGYGSRLSVELPVNDKRKIQVKMNIPSVVALEYNYYIDMGYAISELEARLGQSASLESLEDLKAAISHIEKTYIQIMANSLGLDEPTFQATKYALYLAKELGFKFPEDPVVFVHDHTPGP